MNKIILLFILISYSIVSFSEINNKVKEEYMMAEYATIDSIKEKNKLQNITFEKINNIYKKRISVEKISEDESEEKIFRIEELKNDTGYEYIFNSNYDINLNELRAEIIFKIDKENELKLTGLIILNRNNEIIETKLMKSIDKVNSKYVFVEKGDNIKVNGEKIEILSDFYISKTEVTQDEYKFIMGTNPSAFDGQDKPVENVSWIDAIKYCNKLSKSEEKVPYYEINTINEVNILGGNGYRLPTKNEWIYAAYGGNNSKKNIYSGSNKINDVAWYSGNSGGQTREVGTLKENELGLYDMSGNVWEWTETKEMGGRVNCGGSWYFSSSYSEIISYGSDMEEYKCNSIGFRIAQNVE